MDNFESESNLYQAPSFADQISVNIMDINPEEPQQFIPLSLTGHNENIAAILPKSTLDRISAELVEGIEEDINSRKEWEDGLAEAIELLGLKTDAKIDFPFDNACGSYSPIMMQVINDFLAVAISELLPLEGPSKQFIVGDVTDEIEDQADRIESFFNIFLTEICEEYYPDMKKMLIWVCLVGMCIRKTYFDRDLGRPTSGFIMPQDFIVNYGTTNLKTCWRMTEVLSLDKRKVFKKEQNGTFIETNISPDEGGDESTIKKTLDQVQGVENASTDNKINYTFYECHTYLDMEQLNIDAMNGEDTDDMMMDVSDNQGFRPYIITIHKKTNKIVALYRNWEEGSTDYERTDFYTDFGYAEGLGFYKYGAAHLIGGLAKASTALLRQTIDGQTLSNFPGGIRAKGMPLENNNISIGPCEFIEMDTGGLPINQAIMMMPYKEPSPYINALRNELETSASRIMGAANAQIPEFNANAPVGTTLALLDIMNLIQSTVLRGLRDSMSREFKKFYKIFAQVLPDEPYKFDRSGGNSYISKNDFIDQISMIPIADPHLTTKMQRIMRSQYLQDLCLKFPDLYNRYEVNKIALKEIKLTDSQIENILPDKMEVAPLDPITENQNLIVGKAARASIDQDHTSHLVVHEFILQDPSLPPQVAAEMAAHISQHKAFQFQIQMQQMMGMMLPPNPEELPPQLQNQIAMQAAEAISQQQQQAQENAPPPLLDPAAVMLEKVKVEDKAVDQREISSQREAQTKAFEAQLDYEAKMKALEIKEQELEMKASQGML